MKKRIAGMLFVLCAIVQGAWAQTWTEVTKENLVSSITNNAYIRLTEDIQLSNYLNIEGITVTIDLNGHKLSRNIPDYDHAGHVIWAHNGSTLTLTSSEDGGSIEGGMANNGGAIHIPHGNTVTATNVIFRNNSAADHAGAIWNNGTFTATNCTFTGNSSKDVGAIYNSVQTEGTDTYAGTATLTNCTFTGNWGTTGAGALANALGNTVMTISGCTITGNNASGHGGGIWNGGTLTVDDSSFENNTANDVGGIYNAVSDDGTIAGSATLTGCSFTGNVGTAGAGALANAMGNTEMTISGCTITGNTAGSNGGGIWNGGTLKMQGTVTVTDNHRNDGLVSNVYLKDEKVITLTGALTENSSIGVELENATGTFTSGYNTYNSGVAPSTIFTADLSVVLSLILYSDEAYLTINGKEYYVERSWDDTNKKVVSTQKVLTGFISYDGTLEEEGVYKKVTADNGSRFQMGGYINRFAENYVVYENVSLETIVVLGNDVHLVLADNSTLTLTGGLILEDDHKLYIHCQSYGDKMGKLIVTNKNAGCAGIGSSSDEDKCNVAGELVIHGGHIEATGSEESAGIGSGSESKGGTGRRCKSVTVYGGYVKATGSKRSAGIGGGGYFPGTPGINGGDFYLYGGTVLAIGGSEGAGIGGGSWGDGGQVYVYGGSLTAIGGEEGPGIGGGSRNNKTPNSDEICGGMIRIYGGTVTANGGISAAGIGGGKNAGGALFYINGGTVTANGGISAAGIGGGDGGVGGNVFIDGGMVTANGGKYAAGIGGGESKFGGTVIIGDGTVTANGGISAAGIGGGEGGAGGDVKIIGGTVTAKAGTQGGKEGRAIGQGKRREKTLSNGTLTFEDATMMVGAGNNGSVERIYNADERVNACWFRSYAEVSPCTHPSGITYTINGADAHTSHCKHCSLSEKAAHFNSDGTGKCICGYKDGEGYCTITLATSSNGTGYEGVGITANVGNNMPYTLPVCSSIPEGYDFAGWVVAPTSQDNGILPNEGETLKQAGENITVTDNVTIVARYKNITISLADDDDNGETLYTYNGRKAASVTLTGRKLWKDGNWNSLCLPFSLTAEQVSAQLNPVALMELDTDAGSYDHITGFEDGTLYLNFKNASSIEAGKPYIIKWEDTDDYIENPVFSNVTINNALTEVESADDAVTFVGSYTPVNIDEGGDNTMLYIGTNNTLYYPSSAMTIGTFRAYFQLNGITAGTSSLGNIRGFVLNFSEETTGVTAPLYDKEGQVGESSWFTLDGRRLSGKPTTRGIYLNGGRKVVVTPRP